LSRRDGINFGFHIALMVLKISIDKLIMDEGRKKWAYDELYEQKPSFIIKAIKENIYKYES